MIKKHKLALFKSASVNDYELRIRKPECVGTSGASRVGFRNKIEVK